MRVGSLVFSVEQGLGRLAKSFFEAGILTDVLVVRHGRRPEQEHWFPGQPRLNNVRDWKTIKEFVSGLDVFLALETPFEYRIYPYCREKGIKTACMTMYECAPREPPERPDAYLCPSLLDLDFFPGGTFIPVPVDVPWKLRERVTLFTHNGGNGGLRGRNGTAELLAALPYVKSPARFILRTQGHWGAPIRDERVTLHSGTVPYEQLWEEGDVFLWPHKFDGLSLPLNEARASGMLVMAPDRHPDNTWLPPEPLIPVAGYKRACVSPRCLEFDEAIIDPKAIAARIDEFYGTDISEYSRAGKAWAEENSWANLKPRYSNFLEELADG